MKGTPEEPSVYKNDGLHAHSPHLTSSSLLLDLDIMATKEKSLAQQLTPKGQSASRCDHSANTQQHQALPRDTRERRNHCMPCDGFFHNELATKFLSDPRVVTENACYKTYSRWDARKLHGHLQTSGLLRNVLRKTESSRKGKRERGTGWRANSVTEYAVNCDTSHGTLKLLK